MKAIWLRILVVCLSLALGLYGQGTTSRVLGVVQDATGAAVPAAAVQLTGEATGVTFALKTSEAGAYVFEAVQSGLYTVTVEAAGFKKFVARGNAVTIGQPTTVNVRLEVGALAESIEVSGAAEAVQTSTSGNYGNLYSDRVIRDLPIVGTRGRNPLDLVYLQPGVVGGANTGGGVHVHGARDRAWNFTLDGIDTNETSAGGSNFSPLRTNPDMLAEFRIITSNPTAEVGRNSGAQVAMITRSGSNELHGGGFWFYRTPRLNANEWEYNMSQPPLGKRKFVQNIFGGSVGGPIVKNRTFFFANIQRLMANQTNSVTRTVYTADARKGILRYVKGGRNSPAGAVGASVDFNGNVLPGVSIGTYNVAAADPQRLGLDKTIQAMLDGIPLPNNFSGGDGLNTALFVFATPERERQRDVVFKVDHVLNQRNTVFARVAFGRQDTVCDSANTGQPIFPGMDCFVNTERSPKNLAFNWRWNPVPSITNELVVGLNKFTFNFLSPLADLGKISMSGPVDTTTQYEWGNLRTLRTWQVVENLGWFRGAHAFKFGGNIRLQQHVDERGSIAGYNAVQTLNFSTGVNTVDPATFGIPADINTTYDRPAVQSHINFLLGRVGSTARGFASTGDKFIEGIYDFDARFPEYDLYWQDTWKVRKNLTVDLGLRWEAKLSPRTPDGRLKAPDKLMTVGAAPSTTVKWAPGPLYKDSWRNFGPSLGVAWDPTGAGKMSVRANYRLAFDRMATFGLSSAIFPNLPGTTLGITYTEFGQGGGRLANVPRLSPPSSRPSDLAQPIPFSSSNVTVVDPGTGTPTTHMWSLSLQREIAPRTVLDVSYIGRRAYSLYGAYNVNQAEIFRNGFLDAFKTVKAGGESPLINTWLQADSRRSATETGSQMVRRLYSSDLALNSVAAVASSIAARLQGGRSVTDLSGAGPYVLWPFPQFGGGVYVIDSNDFSTYHAFEAQLERRISRGVSFQASYTWAKSLDTRSFDPIFTRVSTGSSQSASSTPFDIDNRKLNYGRSDFDRTHAWQMSWLWELPVGKGRAWGSAVPAALDHLIGGWQVAGYMRLTSGRPMTVYSGAYTFSSVVQSMANCTGCSQGMAKVFDDAASGYKWFFDAGQRGLFSAPGPGEFGSSGRNVIDGPGYFTMAATVLKRVSMNSVREGMNLEFRADMTNLTNSPSFGFPTLTLTSTTFGRIRNTVASYSRQIQLGAKINF